MSLCPRLVCLKMVFSLLIGHFVLASPIIITAIQAISSVKVRYTCVFITKSRNGCITWYDRIRHLEYNEAKPTYERCSKDKMKCDGYLPPKPPKPPRRRVKPKAAPAKLAVVPLGYPIHNVPLLISKVFWIRYALPMGYNHKSIRYSVAKQYNKTILSIIPSITASSTEKLHIIIICCLLFISFEGLTSLYDEKPWYYKCSDKDDKDSLMAKASESLQKSLSGLHGLMHFASLEQGLDSKGGTAPTYLPDRDLISGLTFIASATKDEEIEVQALDLLWRLNRREGLLDSRDVVEMHELSRSLSQLMGAPTVDKHWEPKAAAGTPSIIERLRKYLG
ncbi:hypothetical protein HZ326_29229 [Fusarium oxysporum f. sp. albedinis]|nr:hypothetical protein HZ326_29229 [Fusarium oxysporum f. sp. albedinis]